MRNRDTDLVRRLDWFTIFLYIGLVLAGWMNIFAAVYNEDAGNIFDISQKYGKQMLWIVAAAIIAISIIIIDSKFYSGLSYPIYLAVLGLIVITYFIAPDIKGARAWIEIGDFRLQPSEFSKLATSLVLARYLSGYGKKITDFSTLFRASIVILLPILLIILQNDTGSALVYGAFLLVFYRLGMSGWVLVAVVYTVFVFSFSIIYNSWFVSLGVMLLAYCVYWYHARTNKFSSLYMYGIIAVFIIPWAIQQYFELQLPEFMPFAIGLVILLAPAIMYIYKKKSKIIFLTYFLTVASLGFTYSVDYIFNDVLGAHQQSRIRVFFGLESDPKGLEFNVIQSKIAIGSGDFLGKGFLQGTQTKNNFVPEQSTDFIFCTVGEEWGFIGSTIVILSMLLLILRIMFLAEKQRSQFSRIYGYCVASILFFHFLVNIGMTIGLMPVIGIPLPFFSYGGSSLWGFTMLLFIFIKLDSDRDVLIQ